MYAVLLSYFLLAGYCDFSDHPFDDGYDRRDDRVADRKGESPRLHPLMDESSVPAEIDRCNNT